MRRNGAFAGSYGPIYFGPRRIERTSVEHSFEMQNMNDDVPARDVEGLTSFYAEKTAHSLCARQEDRGRIRADDVYRECWRSTHLSDDGGDTPRASGHCMCDIHMHMYRYDHGEAVYSF